MNFRSPSLTASCLSLCLSISAIHAALIDPESAFRNPPQDAQPGVWWHWMGSNVSRDGITRDLESFKEAGVGSATIFGMADVCTPWAGHIENPPGGVLLAFTDPWWKLVRHAAAEGKRLGVDVGIHNCPGYTSTGGPWITPELAMQQIFHSRVDVEGGRAFSGELPKPVIDPRGDMLFPMINKDTGELAKPIIEGRKTYWRDIAVLAVPTEGTIGKDRVIDLTASMNPAGELRWTPPDAGKWSIYRFGHTTMGALTQPNQWEIMGLECDKMSEKAVSFHLRHVLGELRKHLGPLVGTGLQHMLLDSYEAGTPSWTPLMPQEFRQRRGYSITEFLPVFAGRVVAGDAETAKFRADFDRTIADLYRDVLFKTMERMLRDANIRFVCEPYGGPFQTSEVTPHVHRVMTEFWTADTFKAGIQHGILNAGDGKLHNILEAEAFTGAPDQSSWTETPGWLKTVGDGAYLAGINRFVLHTNPHQPWGDRVKPGMTMGQWGSHFGRTQTWWEPGKAWLAYLARCQALLQWGAPAAPSGSWFAPMEGNASPRGVHRTDGKGHLFFIAVPASEQGKALASFRVGGMQPELWDPVTGEMRDLTDFRIDGDVVRVPLDFAAGQSHFVVFRKPAASPVASQRNFPQTIDSVRLSGPWQVKFDPRWGGPEQAVTFHELVDWTTHADPGIRYYSGTAVYRTTFDLESPPVDASFLALGTVKHLARVRINGRKLGVAWCAPWRVGIPAGLLRKGGNRLEIAVTNVWANRLIGDEQEPDDCEWLNGHFNTGRYLRRFPDWFVKGQPRPSSGRVAFTTWNYFNKDSKPVSSGLSGPVRLLLPIWKQPTSEIPEVALAEPSATSASEDAFEAELPAADRLVPVADLLEVGQVSQHGGSSDAAAVRNGTTRNGSGTAVTLDDAKTFRAYGQGNSLLFKLNGDGVAVGEIQSFAGHRDGRASQAYSVWIAKSSAPDHFIKVAEAKVISQGGATRLRVPLDQSGVAAVRLDFTDGPLGFNVYREFCLLRAVAN
jgi:alpha-L-rhamnosidase